ncbi:MAG: proteasome subunit beta [Nitrospirota bacterium]
MNALGASFYDLLRSQYAYLGPQYPIDGAPSSLAGPSLAASLPHGTTVLALRYADGVVVAGDRRATEGYQISGRRIEKVFKVDEWSAMAISGAAGPCIEMARLFQTELEHYEKIEGTTLSVDGKANKLAQMVKGNLPAAFQGLVVIPLFVGFDHRKSVGRIFKYDVAGGRYEETDYHATGSGGKDARTTIKQYFKSGLNEQDALGLALEALFNAGEEDVATGSPDPTRGIFPTVKLATAQGVSDVGSDRIEPVYAAFLEKRRER